MFTVSATSRGNVQRYIANQTVDHRTVSFRDELKSPLRRVGIEYEERYLD